MSKARLKLGDYILLNDKFFHKDYDSCPDGRVIKIVNDVDYDYYGTVLTGALSGKVMNCACWECQMDYDVQYLNSNPELWKKLSKKEVKLVQVIYE